MGYIYENYVDMIVEKESGIVTATLNRPDKLNALSPGMRVGLRRVIEEVHMDDDARVLIITGAGRGFCSGADMSAQAAQEYEPSGRWERLEPRYGWVNRLRNMDKPVIAAINGVAAGGGLSIALACDIRIASDNARLISVFVSRGLIPDTGATYFLPRIVGTDKALELIWTSDTIDAREAERIGLVTKVVPHDDLMSVTKELASRIAKGPPIAIELSKRAVYRGLERDLLAQGEYEEYLQFRFVTGSEDYREGRLAFQEKRDPIFKGR